MAYKKLYNTPEYTPIEISTDAEMAAVHLHQKLVIYEMMALAQLQKILIGV